MIDTKKVEKLVTTPDLEYDKHNIIVTPEVPESQSPQDFEQDLDDNYFLSFEEFRAYVKDDFINGSGIAPELFAERIEFHQEQEFTPWGDVSTPIHEALDWKPYKRSWKKKRPLYAAFLMNEDGTVWQAIVSIPNSGKNKPYSYLAPTNNGDRVFLPPVPSKLRRKIGQKYGVEVPLDGSFWKWFETAKIPRIPTEGGKKGLKLLSEGYVPLTLYGCTCGGKEEVIPDLSRFNKDGSVWLLGYDRDDNLKTKRKVNAGKKRLASVLSKQSIVCIEEIYWSPEQGKGVDDLIVNCGVGAFDIAYAQAYSRAVKQSTSGGYEDDRSNSKNKTPSQAQTVQIIKDDFEKVILFNSENNTWMYYGLELTGMWSEISDEAMEALIYKKLLSEGFECFSSSFISGVLRLLRHNFFCMKWNESVPTEYLPFEDGVLDIKNQKLLDHAPKYKFTWQLPRKYENDGNWENIEKFLSDSVGGDPKSLKILYCFCNAVLKGRHDLQKYLYILGKPGSGKGTFVRLLTNLIGEQNTIGTDLKTWNNNNFETSRAYNKRLVLFPEQSPYHDDITKFLSLTGEDRLRLEKKGKDAKKEYIYKGMVLVAGNIYCWSGALLNAIRRRETLVIFNNSPEKVEGLDEILKAELSAFTEHILSIPDKEVTRALCGKKDENTIESWEARMGTDSIAWWANYHIICDPLGSVVVGSNKNEVGENGEARTLYGSYAHFAQNAGANPSGFNKFSIGFKDILGIVWGTPFDVEHTNKGNFIKGVRLRRPGLDDHIPSYDMELRNKSDNTTPPDVSSDELSDELVTNFEEGRNYSNGAGSSDSDELFSKLAQKNQPIASSILSLSSNSTEVVHTAETTSTSTLPIEDTAEPKTEQPQYQIKVGDFVIVGQAIDKVRHIEAGWITISDGRNFLPERLEVVEPSIGVELLRDCIDSQDWDMVTELTENWHKEYKSEVYRSMSSEGKRLINNLKPVDGGQRAGAAEGRSSQAENSPPQPIQLKPGEIPVFKEGAEFYLNLWGGKVCKIFQVFDRDKEASCKVEDKGTMSIKFTDLLPLPHSPVIKLSPGDQVRILSGKKQGKIGSVFIVDDSNRTASIKLDKGRGNYYHFYGHQVEKA